MSTPSRSRSRGQVLLGLAFVVVAFLGVILVGGFFRGSSGGAQAQHISVIGAAHLVKTGTAVVAADLTTVQVAILPTGAQTDRALVVGKIARVDIAAGTPILDSMLASPAAFAPAKLYFTLPAGFVALNIPTGDISPYVQPGDQVDVIASLKATGAGVSSQTQTTLKGLKVLSVGTPGTPTAGNLVVQVTLQQAQQLEFIVKNLDFTYVLKSPLDAAGVDPTTSAVDLPGIKAQFNFK